jgi:hypothetical protein
MVPSSSLFALEDFARGYIRGITDHSQIRTEHLVEAFRGFYGLPPFPSASDLSNLCVRLGIGIHPLMNAPEGLIGANAWGTGSPSIFISPDLSLKTWESTVGHEVREVLENAFKRVNKDYVGLDTHNNKVMNPESNSFAGHLLMQSKATRDRLWEVGFDLPAFSQEKGRSLSSVVVRVQELYSKRSAAPGPIAGFWLFEAPWPKVTSRAGSVRDLVVHQRAHLKGFSLNKSGRIGAMAKQGWLPDRGGNAADFAYVARSIDEGRPQIIELSDGGLFREDDLLVIAEPFFVRGVIWRVLVCAVRQDKAWMLEKWVARLDAEVSDRVLASSGGASFAPSLGERQRFVADRPATRIQWPPRYSSPSSAKSFPDPSRHD